MLWAKETEAAAAFQKTKIYETCTWVHGSHPPCCRFAGTQGTNVTSLPWVLGMPRYMGYSGE